MSRKMLFKLFYRYGNISLKGGIDMDKELSIVKDIYLKQRDRIGATMTVNVRGNTYEVSENGIIDVKQRERLMFAGRFQDVEIIPLSAV